VLTQATKMGTYVFTAAFCQQFIKEYDDDDDDDGKPPAVAKSLKR